MKNKTKKNSPMIGNYTRDEYNAIQQKIKAARMEQHKAFYPARKAMAYSLKAGEKYNTSGW